jgi:hypothetical protein
LARDDETSGDRYAERVLLARARGGDLEALRGLVHRYASLVWAACAQVAPDEAAASVLFGQCWEAVLGSLHSARREPGLDGTVLRLCEAPLREVASEGRVAGALIAARELAADRSLGLEVPTAALLVVTDRLAEHGERLERETEDRRAGRRRRLVLPVALAVGLIAGGLAAWVSASRAPTEDYLARRLRERVTTGGLVSRFQDVVLPPFEAIERPAPDARLYEEIGLVLEELANLPGNTRAAQLSRLQQRVVSLDLIDFAASEAEELRGADRTVMAEVCVMLEELVNL